MNCYCIPDLPTHLGWPFICTEISQQPMSLFQFPLRFLFGIPQTHSILQIKEIKEVNLRFRPTLSGEGIQNSIQCLFNQVFRESNSKPNHTVHM